MILAPIPSDPDIALALQTAADAHALDPQLLRGVAYVESRYNPRAVSPAGARGLLQLMPRTAAALGVPGDLAFDPMKNAEAGARYLAQLLRDFDAKWRALAAYNWGEGNVREVNGEWSRFPSDTQEYVRNVYLATGYPVPLASGLARQVVMPR